MEGGAGGSHVEIQAGGERGAGANTYEYRGGAGAEHAAAYGRSFDGPRRIECGRRYDDSRQPLRQLATNGEGAFAEFGTERHVGAFAALAESAWCGDAMRGCTFVAKTMPASPVAGANVSGAAATSGTCGVAETSGVAATSGTCDVAAPSGTCGVAATIGNDCALIVLTSPATMCGASAAMCDTSHAGGRPVKVGESTSTRGTSLPWAS